MCPSHASCKLFHAALCVLAFGVLAGCGDIRPPIDVSGVDLPATHREVNWMTVLDDLPKDENRAKSLEHLRNAHPEFWQTWCEDILQLGPAEDTMTVDVLGQFTAQMAPMLAAIDTTSGTATVLERESHALKEGLKRLQVIDPNAEVPDVIWMPSGFNLSLIHI